MNVAILIFGAPRTIEHCIDNIRDTFGRDSDHDLSDEQKAKIGAHATKLIRAHE